jgi:hypothetical protein
MKRLSNPVGCLLLLVFLLGPGLILDHLLHSVVWTFVTPLLLIILMVIVAALGPKRKITPQQFADRLEKHLLGTEGPYDWDDTVSVTPADERLEILRQGLSDFDQLDTAEKRDELCRIIEALRRGEIPLR